MLSVKDPTIMDIASAPLNLCRALTPISKTDSLKETLVGKMFLLHTNLTSLGRLMITGDSLSLLHLTHEVVKLDDG